LSDGTRWARVRSVDIAGNAGAWSTPASFYLDATPPAAPTVSGIADGTRVPRSPSLGATFSDAAGHAGAIAIQVCSDAGCAHVVHSASRTVANGESASGSPALADGRYYVRASATDDVGNETRSPVLHFVVDTTPPAAPTLVTADGLRTRSTPVLVART